MFKNLFLMLALVTSAGVNATVDGDGQVTDAQDKKVEEIVAPTLPEAKVAKPGLAKRFGNAVWGNRSNLSRAGIIALGAAAAVTIIPSVVTFVWGIKLNSGNVRAELPNILKGSLPFYCFKNLKTMYKNR